MTRALYQGYLKLCKSWGTDPRKSGRDLGAYIRERVAVEFKEADLNRELNLTVIKDPLACQAKLDSLNRLASNTYYQESDAKIIPSTGLLRQELEMWTSSDGLQASKEMAESSKMEQLKLSLKFYTEKYLTKRRENVVVIKPEDDTKKLPKSDDTSIQEASSVKTEETK